MSEADVTTEVDLNELYDQDIPCRTCGKPATLRSIGHGCSRPGRRPPWFRCFSCWKRNYTKSLQRIAQQGAIRCSVCEGFFYTPEAFSDYRPF